MKISEGQWRLGSFRYGVRGKAGKFGHVAGPWRETVDEAVRQQERLKTPEKVQELSEGEYEQQFNSEGDGQQEETETDGLPQWPLTGAAKRRYPSMYSSSLQSQGERGRGRERGGGGAGLVQSFTGPQTPTFTHFQTNSWLNLYPSQDQTSDLLIVKARTLTTVPPCDPQKQINVMLSFIERISPCFIKKNKKNKNRSETGKWGLES